MIQITYLGMFVFITLCWIVARFVSARVSGSVDIKKELRLLTLYVCILVISRFVYFPMHLKNGHVAPIIFDIHKAYPFKCSFKPFLFLEQKYAGYKRSAEKMYGSQRAQRCLIQHTSVVPASSMKMRK